MPDQCFAIRINSYYSNKLIESLDNTKFIQDRIVEPIQKRRAITNKKLSTGEFFIEECTPYYEMTIDSRKGDMPYELLHINNAIDNAQYILTLEDDWDGNGAVKTPEFVFNRTKEFIKNYAIKLFNIYAIVIDDPYISQTKDGSINLEWSVENASLIVKIKNDSRQIAYYYGETLHKSDNEEDKFDFNGQIPTVGIVDQFLSFLKNLPKVADRNHTD